MSVTKKELVLALSGLAVLAGCSPFYSSKEYSALHINPVMNVRHADTSAENLYHLGRYYHRMLSYANAIATYQKSLAVNPDYVEAHNALGVIYSSQKQYALALEHFQKAIELTPTATYLHNNLGYAYLLQERYGEAATAFEEALHFDPQNQKASRNLATIHKRMDKRREESEQMAVSPVRPQKPEELTGNIPQTLTTQPPASQPLVQIASNVYEFRNDHERPQATSHAIDIAEPTAHPVTASPTLQPIHLTPIVADRAEKAVSKKENTFAAAPTQRIEVSNGNGVTGMARNIASYLKQFGFDNTRLTNHQTFQQAHTEIHYHLNAHALAEQISQLMPAQVKIMETTELREDIQLKIVVGRDIASEMAYFTVKEAVQLAKLTSEIQ